MAPKIGPIYLIEIADPKGINCIARKKVDNDNNPKIDLKLRSKGFLPTIDIRRNSIYGKINTRVPIVRQKTTWLKCISDNALAMTFIIANDSVAANIYAMALLGIYAKLHYKEERDG